ncbi:hypothetical protein N7346_17435 [Aeromonas caviae]|uniref:hypothetical protein n=1 Tax=Aeromonas caviae TaxID=648 RepID=UPI00244726EA|nr:hypothetical protein [Aeromonas caviae]MDH0318816.1 hypothetical protein [Aeromonas caviae]
MDADLKQVISIAGTALALAGCIVFYLRTRTPWSLLFVLSVLGVSAWLVVYNLLSSFTLASDAPYAQGNMLIFMHRSNDFVVSILSTLASISFLVSTYRLPRPNNSFKPKPLRGSA